MLLGYLVVAYLFFSYLKPRHVTILRKIFVCLGWVFILCGATHGMRALSFFVEMTWALGIVNGISSVITVVLLIAIIPMVPTIMKFPSASAMSRVNVELRQEISDLLDKNAELATVDNLKAVENISLAIRAIREVARSQCG